MHVCIGCNYGDLVQRVRFALYPAGSAREYELIRGQHVISRGQEGKPSFNLCGFLCVLFACFFDACLYVAEGHSRRKELGIIHRFTPSRNGTIDSICRFNFAAQGLTSLRDDQLCTRDADKQALRLGRLCGRLPAPSLVCLHQNGGLNPALIRP